MERVEGRRDEGSPGGGKAPQSWSSPQQVQDRVVSLGQSLLERLDVPVVPTALGLPSTVLPAGGFGLLVLGIPIPVFSYMGDDNQALQLRIVDILRTTAGRVLGHKRRVALHSFSLCFDAASEEEILELLPAFSQLNGSRKASYLGVQLVTVLPLSENEVSLWPEGPPGLPECADRFLGVLPLVYRQLDQDLVRIHQTRTTREGKGTFWATDPSG